MSKLVALIPAAGGGSRLGAALPKQYLRIAGRPLLHHAVASLLADARVGHVYVVLAPGDACFRTCDWTAFVDRLTPLYCGGETRAASVYNGLLAVNDAVDADDWLLVHDAARPCLDRAALARLISEVRDDVHGGLLAVPVADTLKRADDAGRVATTEPRERLWRAQTPQMFRYRLLIEALRTAPLGEVTDEASAVERLGVRPRLVMGSACNLKVTYPEDVRLAELMLTHAATLTTAACEDPA